MLFDPYAYDLARSARQSPPPGVVLATEALLEVPQEARAVLWQGLTQAVSGALEVWERLPAGHQGEPPPLTIQHAGKRRFQSAALRRQTLAGWHRLLGIELRLAAEALEALIVAADAAAYRATLADQCARVGQLYAELKRRAGACVALSIVRWEVRLLRYRGSAALAPLIYD